MNTATAPLEEDAHGRLLGIVASWEVSDSFYLKGAWSRETKEFSNEVARTPVDLDSEQTVIALGAGYRLDPGERTSLYAEALAIVDFEVEHRIPLVIPSRSGPPAVSTTNSTIDGNGLSAAVGVRHFLGDKLELEGQLSRIHTRAYVPRTGGTISDSETMFRVGAHVHPGDAVSVGAFVSHSRHTDPNFDNIRSSAFRSAISSDRSARHCGALLDLCVSTDQSVSGSAPRGPVLEPLPASAPVSSSREHPGRCTGSARGSGAYASGLENAHLCRSALSGAQGISRTVLMM